MSGGGGGGGVGGVGDSGGGSGVEGGEPRGGELVCRLVAATPPYLYSAAGLPHCFFFSELLRGLVRAKRPLTPPLQPPHWTPPPPKRFRPGGHSSAFTVPPPRSGHPRPATPPPPHNPLAPGRVLHGLKRIYTAVADTRPPSQDGPLPAVIGLELVVDYVKHEKEPKV